MRIHKFLFLLQCHELVPGTCVCLIQPPAASPSAGTMLRVPWGSTRSPTAPWQETPTAGWRLWVIRWSLLETRQAGRPLTFKNQHFLLILSNGQECCVWIRFSQFKCCSFLYKDVINIVRVGAWLEAGLGPAVVPHSSSHSVNQRWWKNFSETTSR